MSVVKKIILVFKTHFDIGFTDLAKEVVSRYGTKMLPDVVKTCESTQELGKQHQFVWTMSAWPLLQSLKPGNAKEDVISKAEDLIKQGQIAWHALPFTTHTEFCGLEELIRGMYFSRQLSSSFGIWPISAKMTDVPGHTWILPSLLAKANVKFLHLGCNESCESPEVPILFFWEGPDGNRVLVFYNNGGYGSSLVPPKDWNLPVWLAVMHTGDNIGPQDASVIRNILMEVQEEMPDAEVVVGTLDDFYYHVLPYLKDIPIVKKDLADSWIRGTGSYPKEVGLLRSLRHVISDAEKALSFGTILNLFEECFCGISKRKIDLAFENCILFDEHTWGLDVKTTLGFSMVYKKKDFMLRKKSSGYKRLEESWNEQRARVTQIEVISNQILPDIFDRYARSADIEGERLIIFNGLGWKRDGYVCLEKYGTLLFGKLFVDPTNGENLKLGYVDSKPCIFVKGIPAFGYKTFIVVERTDNRIHSEPVKSAERTAIIENDWFLIEADRKTGTIISLQEKTTGKEWVDFRSDFGFAQYVYDIYGINDITEYYKSYSKRFFYWSIPDLGRMSYPELEHMKFIPGPFSIEIEKNDNAQSLVMRTSIEDSSVLEYGNAKHIMTRVTIYHDRPYIDIAYELDGKQETPLVESGHFVFPINLENPDIRINKVGSVVDPATDIPRNANNLLYCCENWADISDGENGLLVIPFDTPLFSIGSMGVHRFIHEYKQEEPVLFFNCFNNSYGTNFPQWIGGDLKFRYRFVPHMGDWRKGEVWKYAFESVEPLIAGYASARDVSMPKIPLETNLFEELDGMQVVAFKPAESGIGYVLRIRELKGEARCVEIIFARSCALIERYSLVEVNEGVLAIDCDRLAFTTCPFEVHTFHLLFSYL